MLICWRGRVFSIDITNVIFCATKNNVCGISRQVVDEMKRSAPEHIFIGIICLLGKPMIEHSSFQDGEITHSAIAYYLLSGWCFHDIFWQKDTSGDRCFSLVRDIECMGNTHELPLLWSQCCFKKFDCSGQYCYDSWLSIMKAWVKSSPKTSVFKMTVIFFLFFSNSFTSTQSMLLCNAFDTYLSTYHTPLEGYTLNIMTTCI